MIPFVDNLIGSGGNSLIDRKPLTIGGNRSVSACATGTRFNPNWIVIAGDTSVRLADVHGREAEVGKVDLIGSQAVGSWESDDVFVAAGERRLIGDWICRWQEARAVVNRFPNPRVAGSGDVDAIK